MLLRLGQLGQMGARRGGEAAPSLSNVLSGLVFDWYSGDPKKALAETLADQIAGKALAVNGAELSEGLYTFDGNDYMNEVIASAQIADIHKSTGEDIVNIVVAFKSPPSWTSNGRILSNTTGTNGFEISRASGSYYLLQYAGGGSQFAEIGPISTSQWEFIFLSHNKSTNTLKYALNSSTLDTSALAFGATSAAPDGVLQVGRRPNGTNLLPGGAQIGTIAIGFGLDPDNETLSDVRNVIEQRHEGFLLP